MNNLAAAPLMGDHQRHSYPRNRATQDVVAGFRVRIMPDSDTPRTPPTLPRRRLASSLIFAFSLMLNLGLILLVLTYSLWNSEASATGLQEQHFSGDKESDDKIAIIRVSGVLMDGSTKFVLQQIRQAATDEQVRAVVLRIESPGGTITASEEIHRELIRLRDNTNPAYSGTAAKPIITSMGNLAASGGYYIAMPTNRIYAEPTTITGSIGVFAALPNVSEFAASHGVKVELIRAGNIKAGGSPLQPLRVEERQPWQDLIDDAYDRFLTVVDEGRPALTKEQLTQELFTRQVMVYDSTGLPLKDEQGRPKLRTNSRYRADGGTFTPRQALELKLIDEIGDLHAAIHHAALVAKLSTFQAVTYRTEPSWAEALFGIRIAQPTHPLSAEALSKSLSPKVWYLAAGYELSGTFATP